MSKELTYDEITPEVVNQDPPFIEPTVYTVGDEVKLMSGASDIRTKHDGLDYSKPHKIKDVKYFVNDSNTYRFQLIQLEGSPSWNTAMEFRPADEAVYKELYLEYKNRIFKGKKLKKKPTKKKPNPKQVKRPTGNIKLKGK